MTSKKNELYIKNVKNGFTSIKLPTSERYTMRNAYIPFGMNDDYSMKLEFSANELPLYEKILKKEKDIVTNIMTVLDKTFSFRSKLKRNGKYMPTIMCTVKHRKNKIKSVLYQKNKGEIMTFYDLEKTNSRTVIECKQIWVIENRISCSWEIHSLTII